MPESTLVLLASVVTVLSLGCHCCRNFDPAAFSASGNASLFAIEARGRLGNHLMGYTIVMALKKVLGVDAVVMAETDRFVRRYFDPAHAVPVLEETYCNWQDIEFRPYEGGIDELVENEELHKGKLLNLWPMGYKVYSYDADRLVN